MTNGQSETAVKVGLAKPAYNGAPHGVAQVSFDNPELRQSEPRWNYKSKARRRQEAIDTM